MPSVVYKSCHLSGYVAGCCRHIYPLICRSFKLVSARVLNLSEQNSNLHTLFSNPSERKQGVLGTFLCTLRSYIVTWAATILSREQLLAAVRVVEAMSISRSGHSRSLALIIKLIQRFTLVRNTSYLTTREYSRCMSFNAEGDRADSLLYFSWFSQNLGFYNDYIAKKNIF